MVSIDRVKTPEEIQAENIAREYIRGFFDAFSDEELLEVIKPGMGGYRIELVIGSTSSLMYDYVSDNSHIVEEILIVRRLFQKFLNKYFPNEP